MVTLHATQVPFDSVVPEGHTHVLLKIVYEESGQLQVLLVKIKVFKHVPHVVGFAQVRQFVILHKGIQTFVPVLS